MRTVLAAMLAAVLFTPSPGAAAPLSFTVSGGELSVEFGFASFSMSDDLHLSGWGEVGTASMVSGALLDLEVDEDNGLTTYSYGAGTLTLTLTVEGVQGMFLGSTSPFSFVVCEGCDQLFGGGSAEDFEIGVSGLFDAAIAKALGVSRLASGSIDFGLEDIDGTPDSPSRQGFDHRGFAALELDGPEVPEPGILVLGFVAAAGRAARKRRRG